MYFKYINSFLGILIVLSSCSNSEIILPIDKVLIDIGDSLTAGVGGEGTTMSNVTETLLDESWVIKNRGVGGENTLTIGARQGGIPMYIKESFIIPGDGSKVELSLGLFSSYNNDPVFPLLQGSSDIAGINPCYINGIECELTIDQGNYFINSIVNLEVDQSIEEDARIITALSNETKGIATIFIGQNGGYDSPEDLLSQIDLLVDHKGDENVIIITSHGNGYPEIVEKIVQKYGSKVIDLKKYMSTQAINDALAYNLLPNDGNFPTPEDLIKMESNQTPPSLLFDSIHLNAIGYELLGRLRYKKGVELGYW